MRFHNFKLLQEVPKSDFYWSGLSDGDLTYAIVGKVRPWDDSCREYILYVDGDIVLAKLNV